MSAAAAEAAVWVPCDWCQTPINTDNGKDAEGNSTCLSHDAPFGWHEGVTP